MGSALLAAPLLYAVPARNVVKTIVQPDGTTLQIKLCGDEFLRYYTTLDGVPVKEVGEGFYYAGLSADLSCGFVIRIWIKGSCAGRRGKAAALSG